MKKSIYSSLLLCALCACSSSDKTEDMLLPEITADGEQTCPVDCQQFKRGSVIAFHYLLSDNVELGSYNIEVHNNFDHHTHSTSAAECEIETEKKPVNPWVFNSDFDIPEGLRTYTAVINIDIPADIDPGNYHFMVRLTDQAGWQQLKSMAVKISE